jgi:hypothetical protein
MCDRPLACRRLTRAAAGLLGRVSMNGDARRTHDR